jgi:hypothetical protein
MKRFRTFWIGKTQQRKVLSLSFLYLFYCFLYFLLRPRIPQFSAFSLIPILLVAIHNKKWGLLIAFINFPVHIFLLFVLGEPFFSSLKAISIPFSAFLVIAFITSLLVELNKKNKEIIQKLHRKIEENKKLKQLVPICSECKKIRDDAGFWNHLEDFISKNSKIEFTHGYCPECSKRLLEEIDEDL